MKKSLAISIPKPCSENWNNFTTTSTGGFCGSCNKTVTDFTKMSDKDILDFLNNRQTHTCGRFRSDQLKTYSVGTPAKVNPGFTLFKASLMSILFLLMTKQSFAQIATGKTKIENFQTTEHVTAKNTNTEPEQIMKGVVTDEFNALLPGVNVVLRGAAVGTTTDAEGRFEFPQKLKLGDVLLFSYIGFDTKEYVVPNIVTGDIKITITMDMAITMGEVAVSGIYTENNLNIHTWWSKIKRLFN